MKPRTYWFITAALLATLEVGLNAQPIRTIGTFKVDLGPVMEWMNKPKGERPMAHWKKVQFVESYGLKHGALEVDATIDGATTRRILIQNVPKPIIELLARRAVIRFRLNVTSAASAYAHAAATQAAGQASVAWSASGSPEFVNGVAQDEAARQRAAAQAAAVAELTEAQRRELEKELNGIEAALAKTFDVAMFTGRQFVGRELWDCGQPAR